MKRIIAITLTVLLAVLGASAIIFGGCAEPAPEKPIELRFASFIPPTDIYATEAVAWGDRLTEATNGRVKVIYYFAESLAKMPDLYDATAAGTCDLSQMTPSTAPERMPLCSFIELPMLYDNPTQLSQVFVDLYNKYEVLRDEFGPTKLVWMQTPGPQSIASKDPIHTMEDLQGVKIFTVTKADVEAWAGLGATPVTMAPTEAYTALERGVLDAVAEDFTAVYIWKTFEVTKYRTDNVKITFRSTPVIINTETYNNLPEDIKQAFDEVSHPMELTKSIQHAYEQRMIENIAKIKEYDKSVGNPEFYVLPDAEHQRWTDKVYPITERWVSDMEARGLPGKAFFADLLALVEQYK